MRLNLLLFISLFTTSLFCQINALTETGDEVLLYENGTWSYKNIEPDSVFVIHMNEAKFIKNDGSTFEVKSKIINIGVWLNPKKWTFEKSTFNKMAEYQFYNKNMSSWGMLITETISVDLEDMSHVAYTNAKMASTNMNKVLEEYRMVNGNKVLHLKMAGKVQGLNLTYLGYYYSNSEGSAQLITWCETEDLESQEKELLDLLNGLVEN